MTEIVAVTRLVTSSSHNLSSQECGDMPLSAAEFLVIVLYLLWFFHHMYGVTNKPKAM